MPNAIVENIPRGARVYVYARVDTESRRRVRLGPSSGPPKHLDTVEEDSFPQRGGGAQWRGIIGDNPQFDELSVQGAVEASMPSSMFRLSPKLFDDWLRYGCRDDPCGMKGSVCTIKHVGKLGPQVGNRERARRTAASSSLITTRGNLKVASWSVRELETLKDCAKMLSSGRRKRNTLTQDETSEMKMRPVVT